MVMQTYRPVIAQLASDTIGCCFFGTGFAFTVLVNGTEGGGTV